MSASLDLKSIRPLRRSDLEVVCRKQGDATTNEEWIVKDPIQLNYFYLDRVQHWLFEKLDGVSSLKDIQQMFCNAFSGAKISEQQLINFCMRLGRDGLLCESISGERLLERQQQQRKTPLHKLPLTLMAIRLPGINAGAVISVFDSLFGWLFTPWAFLLAAVWLVVAFVFGVQSLNEIVWSLPSLANIRFADVAMLLVCISTVKISHELAHAVCCRRMGGQCNEIGIMFLVFSPCLYCNVTDSWMLPSKWKRISIAAAGIYIELLIASVSFFLWSFAETEFLKSLFLNLMIVCSVSTLLVNGNPLMRYDGYFILSDLMDIPNLGPQARKRTWNWITSPFFKMPQSIGSQSRPVSSILLVSYHIASIAYRTFILTVIFFVFYAVLEPFGLQNIAASLAVVYVTCLLAGFIFAFIPMLKNNRRKGSRNWGATITAILLMGGLVYFFLNVRIPHSINTAARVEFKELVTCAARTSGTLEWTAKRGAHVLAGEPIAKLSSFDSNREKTKLNQQVELAKLKIENLTSRSGIDPESRIALPSAQAELTALSDELTMLNQRQKDFEIVAPVTGIVVESFKKPDSDGSAMKMASWHGSALQEVNRGCRINQGETICMIANQDDWKVFLLIDEQKRDLIAGGEKVKLRTSLERGKVYSATIGKIFSDEIETETSGQGRFRVELVLDEPIAVGFHGAEGKAKISIDEQTPFEMCRRFLLESFRFEM